MKKTFRVALCGILAFTATVFAGCENGQGEPLDILEGRFTAVSLADMQTFTAKLVMEDDAPMECVANNEGVAFFARSAGDDEGEWDGYECTGKVMNGKGSFVYEGQGGVRGAVVVEKAYETYCDGTVVYEKETRGDTVEKIKFDGDVSYGIRGLLLMDEEMPDLKSWTENEKYAYEYYLDETDASYDKLKIVSKRSATITSDIFGNYDLEEMKTVVFAFDKAHKLKAFYLVEKQTSVFSDKTWVWDTEYSARPWSGNVQAPTDLSTYVAEVE